ncbi:hypothetical protein DQX05_13785 [Paenibacillus thiaminolyticus]|uniref:Uncharacterized protein n=2 Tax=Paenibacillus thiaminolyticus TaxID=49283 RepID=A0A3A3GYI9_PANTH|nr:hypothetical protein DQX05_13695 [Paenibacillus thiaminolyticus]RJG23314.1 hypothetical protein DQX05_13785 [Paenibacillus thiaminolyticus]
MATKDKMLVFNDDHTCELLQVEEISDQAVLTKRGMYDLSGVSKHIDTANGYILYVANVDMPARIEAAQLRQLRKSTALKRMFEFNVQDKPDFFKYVPYILIALLILFK